MTRPRRDARLARRLLVALLAAALGCAASGPGRYAPDALERSARIVIRSNVRGDLVVIDGEALGPTGPEPFAVIPGRHVVSVTKAGHEAWKTAVDLAPGDVRSLRATLIPVDASGSAGSGATWADTVEFVRVKLQERWGRGEPPSDFGVSDAGLMVFGLRNPADPDVWHRYTVDVRSLTVAPDDLAPSVVGLDCVASDPCFRQQICRSDRCFDGDPVSHHRWFFDDARQGEKITRAMDHLIALARERPAPKRPVAELF